MCYHYSLATFNRLKSLYPDKLKGKEPPLAVNGFAQPNMPVITSNDHQLHYFQWGLVPAHTKTEEEAKSVAKMCLNARVESADTKYSFSDSILQNKKCLIPFTSFFEWRHEGKQKIKYQISHRYRPLSYFAGIWSTCTLNQQKINSFSILTCPANETMEYIHNTKKRMPIIFSEDTEINEFIQVGFDADRLIYLAQKQALQGIKV